MFTGESSQYTKGRKWSENLTTHFVNTSFQIGNNKMYIISILTYHLMD